MAHLCGTSRNVVCTVAHVCDTCTTVRAQPGESPQEYETFAMRAEQELHIAKMKLTKSTSVARCVSTAASRVIILTPLLQARERRTGHQSAG